MVEDRSGGIASFGVGFGERKGGGGDGPQATAEERSFRLVVIAELVPGADWSTGRTPTLDPKRIDAETFDTVMGQLAPSLALDVADPFGVGDPALRVDLVWRERRAMRPSDIAEQVPALRALIDARRVVGDVASRKITAEAGRTQLMRILPRPTWADALVGEVRPARAAQDTAGRGSAPVAAAAAPKPGNGGAGGGLDALLDMVDVGAEAEAGPPSAAPDPVRAGMSEMMDVVTRGARPAVARAVVGTAPERLDKAFRNLMDGILHHPEVRRLEASWRGLRLLVEHCEKKVGIEVDVISAGRDAVSDALKRLAEPDPEGTPVDLVLIDQRIEPVAVDLALLEKWAGLASELLAPIVLAGHPSMLGVDTLEQVARSTGALSQSDDGRAVAMRGVAAREASRWVALVLNDPLVRAPYTTSSARLASPPYDEDTEDLSTHVFTSGAYVVGALCAKSHARLKWPTAILGARDGVVQNLPVHTVRDRGQEAAIPLAVVPSEEVVKEVARAGLTLLACAPNSDSAILSRAPMLHRGAGPSAQATLTLSDQLFVGRFARAVQQVAVAIPAGTDARAAEEVARIALAELFERAAPSGPEVTTKVDRDSLTVTVRPRRFAGISMEELTLGAALG